MCNEHSDCRLDVFDRSIDQSSVGYYRGNGSVNNVINLELLQGKNLCQSASDFILKNHRFKSLLAIDFLGLKSCCDDNRVKVVMTKLACLKLWLAFPVTEDGSIGVPFSNCCAVRSDGFDVI
jgi:hypothetical protein